ncbi:hypothetical protein E1B28_006040 [Marasmius oreades]|uniref:Uncharacterized protein n=1 Tax=Marasmius oreades TaxID=181124 RepID=A0A9P7UUV2_9AGAR|nr:uncharacterized protein E1B28_006040 [Marasmius oreades]KAG7095267.1 hypothetical protein E1B28_006040 [Marasmius oreades]
MQARSPLSFLFYYPISIYPISIHIHSNKCNSPVLSCGSLEHLQRVRLLPTPFFVLNTIYIHPYTMIAAKIVSPPPPLTSNTLTHGQRARLMRTTKKLGQVLGSTPHLLDDKSTRSPTPVSEDWSDDEDEWHRPVSRSSNRGSSSRSTYSISASSRVSRSASVSTRSTTSSASSHTEASWSSHSTRPPLLRLALSSFSQRRSSISSRCLSSPTSSNTSDEEDARFTLQTHVEENPRDSLISPTFRIPSLNTVRLQKMDRIRKKLGDGVPVELVFPVADSDAEANTSHLKTSTVVHITSSLDTLAFTTLPPPPPPPPPSHRARPVRSHYAGARDSIVSTSAHRGPRVKRKPVPKLDPTDPPNTPSKSKHNRLSLILETPHEVDILIESKVSYTSERISEWFSEDENEQWVDYKTYLRMVQDP